MQPWLHSILTWITRNGGDVLRAGVPTILSLISIYLVLKDRRPRLILRTRKGDWYRIEQGCVGAKQTRWIVFRGVIEIYNASGRANAVREYRIKAKTHGGWREMGSDSGIDNPTDGSDVFISNRTPLIIPPYSGVEANVIGLLSLKECEFKDMPIIVEVEDLFGKGFSIAVDAKAVS
jgi:hypothetical protein